MNLLPRQTFSGGAGCKHNTSLDRPQQNSYILACPKQSDRINKRLPNVQRSFFRPPQSKIDFAGSKS